MSAVLCATLNITAMGFVTSILVIRAHSYQLAHDEITRLYGSEQVKGKDRGPGTCFSAAYMSRRETSSSLQSRKWQLFGMS